MVPEDLKLEQAEADNSIGLVQVDEELKVYKYFCKQLQTISWINH